MMKMDRVVISEVIGAMVRDPLIICVFTILFFDLLIRSCF